ALTGLKIKARSPLPTTFTIELANGSEGYIPPPEQHTLGGYTTWPARTAALEVQAEPRIVSTVLTLLEKVSGTPQKRERPSASARADSLLDAKPWGFWRLEEMDGQIAQDATGRGRSGRLEGGFALFLEGAEAPEAGDGRHGRAVHLAGGRLVIPAEGFSPQDGFTLALSFWNGLTPDARPVGGTLLDLGQGSVRLSVGGTDGSTGKLILTQDQDSKVLGTGDRALEPKRWHALTLHFDGEKLGVFLDGEPEIAGVSLAVPPRSLTPVAVGGSERASTRFEGKIDEVVLFDRRPDQAILQALGVPNP
ncbi:MAG: LamG-like jellyroll fold domain-containing protein, partial [Isosphaeraceae bacterium]